MASNRGAGQQIIMHPSMLVPTPPADMTASERDALADQWFRAFAKAAIDFRSKRTAETAAAMALAFGRFVGAYIEADNG